jgi:hypothetical protein
MLAVAIDDTKGFKDWGKCAVGDLKVYVYNVVVVYPDGSTFRDVLYLNGIQCITEQEFDTLLSERG